MKNVNNEGGRIPKLLHTIGDHQEILEGRPGSYPMEYNRQIFGPDTYQYIDWHWHASSEFCMVTRGQIEFKTVSRTLILNQGDGLFINAQQVHTSQPVGETGEYECINISPYLFGPENGSMYEEFMAPVIRNPQAGFLLMRQNDTEEKEMLQILSQCAAQAAEEVGHARTMMQKDETCCGSQPDPKPSYSLALLADLVRLWDALLRTLPDDSGHEIPVRDNERMQEILFYLHENYYRRITLEEIADHVHLCRSECSRFFHSAAGKLLFDYLNEIRLNKSIDLLLHTDKSVTEIAYQTGFSSQSYFSQRFRIQTGMPPERYRKSMR